MKEIFTLNTQITNIDSSCYKSSQDYKQYKVRCETIKTLLNFSKSIQIKESKKVQNLNYEIILN